MKRKIILPLLIVLLGLLVLNTGSARSATNAPNAPLPAPTNIACQGWERDTVLVSWKDNATDEDNYRVERSDNGGAWSEVATISPDGSGNYPAYKQTGVDELRIRFARIGART